MQRAEEMRSSEGVASVDTHSGVRIEEGTRDANAAHGKTDSVTEEAGVAGAAGEGEGGGPVDVDSEGSTRVGDAVAAPPGGRGLEGRGDAEGAFSRVAVTTSATATAAGGGAETGTRRRPGLRRRGLKRQGATPDRAGGEGLPAAPTEATTTLPSEGEKRRVAVAAADGTRSASGGLREDDREAQTPRTITIRRRTADAGEERTQSSVSATERVWRLKRGAELWPGTYVPPIEPTRRRELIYKWSYGKRSEEAGATGGESGRILYVISSYDRGKRLGLGYNGKVDKLDYILMMMDEMREACEVREVVVWRSGSSFPCFPEQVGGMFFSGVLAVMVRFDRRHRFEHDDSVGRS